VCHTTILSHPNPPFKPSTLQTLFSNPRQVIRAVGQANDQREAREQAEAAANSAWRLLTKMTGDATSSYQPLAFIEV
jgi:hypothetical protein